MNIERMPATEPVGPTRAGDPVTPNMLGGARFVETEPVLGYAVHEAQTGDLVTVRLTAEGERWLTDHGFGPWPIAVNR